MSTIISEKGLTDETVVGIITSLYDQWTNQQSELREWDTEVLEYLHSTSTRETTNHKDDSGWGHTTNLPLMYKTKETLDALYTDILFPTSQYMKWEQKGEVTEQAVKKGRATAAYMKEMLEYAPNAKERAKLLEDFIIFGRVAAFTDFERIMVPDDQGNPQIRFEGPVIQRLHPYDYVFDLTTTDVTKTAKIIRQVYDMGQLTKMERAGSRVYTKEVMDKLRARRIGHYTGQDMAHNKKYESMKLQGIGNYNSYLQSGKVEVLCFLGDLYDNNTHELKESRHILVVDRAQIIYDAPMSNITGDGFHYHVYEEFENTRAGVGPLHKVVQLQYMLNHVQNMKANAMDLELQPTLVFRGGDPTQKQEPGGTIVVDTEEDVRPLNPGTAALAVNSELSMQISLYEQVTGVPRELSGIRTPGEKTAMEVDSILSGGQRIPLQKAKEFEQFFWEPVVTAMLEEAKNNMMEATFVRIMGVTTGVEEMIKITPHDLAPTGTIRPVGARGIAEEARSLREFTQMVGPQMIPQLLQPHISGFNLMNIVEKSLNWENKGVFRKFVQLSEQSELKNHATVASQHNQEVAITPEEEDQEIANEPPAL